jgi:hypothetical protein
MMYVSIRIELALLDTLFFFILDIPSLLLFRTENLPVITACDSFEYKSLNSLKSEDERRDLEECSESGSPSW